MKRLCKAAILVVVLLILAGCAAFFNSPPVANFTVNPTTGSAPLTVYVNATNSYDTDGHITSWRWSFGDGGSGYGETTSHRYVAPGTYIIRLTVTDNRGDVDTCYYSVVVTEPSFSGYFYRYYEWDHDGTPWTWEISIPKWLYYEYSNRPRLPLTDPGYYDYYVLDHLDDPYLESLGQAIRTSQGGDYYHTLESTLCFVQAAIAYDWAEYYGGEEYARYPIETLVEVTGDCEDTAILYASLARTLGYGALIAEVATNHDGNFDHMVALVPVHESYFNSITCPEGYNWMSWLYEGQTYALAETAVDPHSHYDYIPLGCDCWGLSGSDFGQIWNVSGVDLQPKIKAIYQSTTK